MTDNELRDLMKSAFYIIENSPLITEFDLNDNIRYGLLGIMKSYDLSFRTATRGGWSWLELCETKTSPALTASEIRKRPFNDAGFAEALKLCTERQGKKPEAASVALRYGWLSPAGDFIESPWGTHEDSAENIIDENGWHRDFIEQFAEGTRSPTCGDYLVYNHGYVLIHCPANNNKPIVTSSDSLTRKQKDFLFSYFTDIGDRHQANQFVN